MEKFAKTTKRINLHETTKVHTNGTSLEIVSGHKLVQQNCKSEILVPHYLSHKNRNFCKKMNR